MLPVSLKFWLTFIFLGCCAQFDSLFISACARTIRVPAGKRTAESARAAKSAELEVVAWSQAEKIAKLETTCADLKCEKECIAAGYRRLSEKHTAFIEKTEQEKMELAEIHATELARLRGDLDLEMRSYMEYHQNVRCQLHELHETVASSFEEVKA
jgi:hypothetical protein